MSEQNQRELPWQHMLLVQTAEKIQRFETLATMLEIADIVFTKSI